MPGPFPGMDPYLESPALWRGVPQGLITFLNQTLNDRLPNGFSADRGERVYLAGPELNVLPDVLVREEGGGGCLRGWD